MNERIRELAIQAAGKGFQTFATSDFDSQEKIERFAELIVQECARICESNGQSYKHSFTPAKAKLAESTSVYCGELIRKYFGVNE